MGAWGTYPKDSDGALDLLYDVGLVVNAKLDEMYQKQGENPRYGYDYAGVVMLLLQKGFNLKYKYIERAYHCIQAELEHLEQDNERGWKDPERTAHDIRCVAYEFLKLLDEKKELYLTSDRLNGKDVKGKSPKWRLKKLADSTLLAPVGWLLRESEIVKTNWSGLGFVGADGEEAAA